MKKITKLLSIVILTTLGSLYAATSLTNLQKESTAQMKVLDKLIVANNAFIQQVKAAYDELPQIYTFGVKFNPKNFASMLYRQSLGHHLNLGQTYYMIKSLNEAPVSELNKVNKSQHAKKPNKDLIIIPSIKSSQPRIFKIMDNAVNSTKAFSSKITKKINELNKQLKNKIDMSKLSKAITSQERSSLIAFIQNYQKSGFDAHLTSAQQKQLQALRDEMIKMAPQSWKNLYEEGVISTHYLK